MNHNLKNSEIFHYVTITNISVKGKLLIRLISYLNVYLIVLYYMSPMIHITRTVLRMCDLYKNTYNRDACPKLFSDVLLSRRGIKIEIDPGTCFRFWFITILVQGPICIT
jgi:hypothetical protein